MPETEPTKSPLAIKLLKVQKAGIELKKDAQNPHFRNRYVTLDTVLEKVLPVLNKEGILVVQMPTSIGGGTPALTTMLVDTATGDSVEGTLPLILQKADPQGVGSAITYARRYALMAALGLVADEDDDGEAARVADTADAGDTVPARW